MFYVIGHDEEVGRKLVEFLQTTDYAGVIFSRWNLPGTFDLAHRPHGYKGGPGRSHGAPLDSRPEHVWRGWDGGRRFRQEERKRHARFLERLRNAQHADRGGAGLQEGVGRTMPPREMSTWRRLCSGSWVCRKRARWMAGFCSRPCRTTRSKAQSLSKSSAPGTRRRDGPNT